MGVLPLKKGFIIPLYQSVATLAVCEVLIFCQLTLVIYHCLLVKHDNKCMNVTILLYCVLLLTYKPTSRNKIMYLKYCQFKILNLIQNQKLIRRALCITMNKKINWYNTRVSMVQQCNKQTKEPKRHLVVVRQTPCNIRHL